MMDLFLTKAFLEGLLIVVLFGIALWGAVFYWARWAWKKRLAGYPLLNGGDGVRVRYCSESRFRKWMKFFPWEGIGTLSVDQGRVTLVGKPKQGGEPFEISVNANDIEDYGRRGWVRNGLLPWIQLRGLSGDFYVCAETGITIFGAENKNQKILQYIREPETHSK